MANIGRLKIEKQVNLNNASMRFKIELGILK